MSTASPQCTVFNPFLAGDFPSVRDNSGNGSTGDLLRFECGQTAELEAECPYLCAASHIFLVGCSNIDISGPITNPIPPNFSISCDHCNASTIQPQPSSTCVDPAHPTCPAEVDQSDPTVRFQTACGSTVDEIAACPFLCTTIPVQGEYHCEGFDATGTIFERERAIQACHKCLPVC